MVTQLLDPAGRDRVTAAVRAAEAHTSGEIVVVTAEQSDAYHDVGLHYAIAAMFLKLGGIWVMGQDQFQRWIGMLLGWHETLDFRQLAGLLFIALGLAFLVVRYVMAWMPLRLALTPRSTKRRRVRRRAVLLFNATAQGRTAGRTAILIYLSQGERMAEIVADEAIHMRVDESRWGEAMAVLVAEAHAGRVEQGLEAAIGKVGAILAEVLPIGADDRNEIPDRVIEL